MLDKHTGLDTANTHESQTTYEQLAATSHSDNDAEASSATLGSDLELVNREGCSNVIEVAAVVTSLNINSN